MPVTPNDPDFLELVKILGIPENAIAFTLRAKVNEIVTVECWYYPDIENDPDKTITKVFKLEPI